MEESEEKTVALEPREYDYSDFLNPDPYEYLYSVMGSPFVFQQKKAEIAKRAKEVGFVGFNKMLQTYIKEENDNKRSRLIPNQTEFDCQSIELACGEWESTDRGIFRNLPNGGRQCACAHPIMPVERLVNIDTGECKLRLAYRRNRDAKWQTTIVGKDVVSTARSITALASQGISVTSTTASGLVDYLNDLENLNYDVIPESKSIGRLGYIDGEGFSPYVDGLQFDGEASYRNLYKSVAEPHGIISKWADTAKECRKMSTAARIMLAASFASPLVSVVGALPFFVHLWGVDSGTGKTVALMLAASVWGNPAVGSYVQTFNATQVGQEKTAAFLNHLPYCMDELQLTKDSKGRSAFDVYQLAQGVGRTRGKKNGGIDLTPTWSNCFLTTGESPLTNMSSGAGAVNRVIDIECTAGQAAITDGPRISGLLKECYGFAGRAFIEKLYGSDENRRIVRGIYQDNFAALCKCDSTEKQAMAAAAILTADQLATHWIFDDGMALTVGDLKEFLASREAVSAGKRAYDYLSDWVASNTNHFQGAGEVVTGECYGVIEGSTAYIIRGIFNRVLTDAGYSMAAVLSYLKANALIETRGRKNTRGKRVCGVLAECIVLSLAGCVSDEDDMDELPL